MTPLPPDILRTLATCSAAERALWEQRYGEPFPVRAPVPVTEWAKVPTFRDLPKITSRKPKRECVRCEVTKTVTQFDGKDEVCRRCRKAIAAGRRAA